MNRIFNQIKLKLKNQTMIKQLIRRMNLVKIKRTKHLKIINKKIKT